jgi:hypothetical protein
MLLVFLSLILTPTDAPTLTQELDLIIRFFQVTLQLGN